MTDEMKAKREKLFSSPKNGYDLVDQAALDAMETYCESYKQYLDNGKTERECAAYTVELAQAQGYVPYQRGMSLKPGDKVYRVNRGKSVMLVKIGRQDLSHGAQIVACHIDSPRLDFKPHPLYEDSELAYGKTHYYGGIRKYQWVAIPLELRGVVVLRDGTVVKVVLGQGSEPKFVITDLLPHLGAEQGKKPLERGHSRRESEHSHGQPPPGRGGRQRPREAAGAGYAPREIRHRARMTSPPPSWRWSPPSTPRIWAWTAASSAHTATTTGCAATPP